MIQRRAIGVKSNKYTLVAANVRLIVLKQLANYLRSILVLVICGCSVISHASENNNAVQLSTSEIAEYQRYSIDIAEIIQSDNIEQALAAYSSPLTIFVRSEVIRALAEPATLSQRNEQWLTEQLSNPQSIVTMNADHPNKQLTVLKIANLANATLHHRAVVKLAKHYQRQISLQDWYWPEFLASDDKFNMRALSRALSDVTQTELNWLVENLVEQASLSSVSNELLYRLLSQANSNGDETQQASYYQQLMTTMLANKADEFSYQMVNYLAEQSNHQLAIDYLAIAANNQALASLALNKLAKNFAAEERSQQLLIAKLKQQDSAFIAAAAISQSDNAELLLQARTLAKSAAKGQPSQVKLAIETFIARSEDK